MMLAARISAVAGVMLISLSVLCPTAAYSQLLPRPRPIHAPRTATAEPQIAAPMPATSAPALRQTDPVAEITLADIGFANGLRFANLGGHRELFVPLPQSGEAKASDLVLVLDDFSAHDARRNLEVQANDRTVAAIVLDGKSRDRTIRVPLGGIKPKNGYLKLSFLYSGAATLDRCIDIRYVGDSLTIRPETAVEVDIGPADKLDIATTAALMPRDVAVVLPERSVTATEIATAIAIARALIAGGRHVSFHRGYGELAELAKRDDAGRWRRGIVLIGPLTDAAGILDAPLAEVAGDLRNFGTLDAVRVAGTPALLVADGEDLRAARLFASPLLPATRGMAAASVGDTSAIELPADRVTFDQLAVPPEQAEVFGRAELTTVIDTRRLPPGRRPTRLLLDAMVAPDGAGERAVVSVFVNERLLGSTVAATGEATHLDLPLPDGLASTLTTVRVLVQRDSAQGDCRFEPQGYPAQILGSSSLVLASAGSAHDFSDLTSHFAQRLEIQLPSSAANHPARMLGLIAEVASQLSPATAPLQVSFASGKEAAKLNAPFIALSDEPPADATPNVHFDRGRVSVTDASGHTLLGLGDFADGAVVQIMTAGEYPGLWIKPMAKDDSVPAPGDLHLGRGDVAFIDANGVALAMSTERNSVVRISYPDQVSWLTVAERFRPWIIAGLWLLATAILLLTLQRVLRRRPANKSD